MCISENEEWARNYVFGAEICIKAPQSAKFWADCGWSGVKMWDKMKASREKVSLRTSGYERSKSDLVGKQRLRGLLGFRMCTTEEKMRPSVILIEQVRLNRHNKTPINHMLTGSCFKGKDGNEETLCLPWAGPARHQHVLINRVF